MMLNISNLITPKRSNNLSPPVHLKTKNLTSNSKSHPLKTHETKLFVRKKVFALIPGILGNKKYKSNKLSKTKSILPTKPTSKFDKASKNSSVIFLKTKASMKSSPISSFKPMNSNSTYKSRTFASVKPVSCKKKYFKTKLDPSLISLKATISKPAPSFLKSSISLQIKP